MREELIEMLQRCPHIIGTDYRAYEWAADYLMSLGVTIIKGELEFDYSAED